MNTEEQSNSITINNNKIIFKSIEKKTINLAGAKVGAIPKEIFDVIRQKNTWLDWQLMQTNKKEDTQVKNEEDAQVKNNEENEKNKRIVEKLQQEKENVLAELKKHEQELTTEEKEELNQYIAKIDNKIQELQPTSKETEKETTSLAEQKENLETKLKELKSLGPKAMYEKIDEIVELEDQIEDISRKMNTEEKTKAEPEEIKKETRGVKPETPTTEENKPEETKNEEIKLEETQATKNKNEDIKPTENQPIESEKKQLSAEEEKQLSAEEEKQKIAELKAYLKEKDVLFEKLSKYEKEVSPEKTKLLKELQEVENKITNLKDVVDLNSVLENEETKNKINTEKDNQNEKQETLTEEKQEVKQTTPPNEEKIATEKTPENNEADLKNDDLLQNQDIKTKKQIINTQIAKLQKIQSPEAEAQINYLKDNLKDLEKAFPNLENKTNNDMDYKQKIDEKKETINNQIEKLQEIKTPEAENNINHLKDNLKDINQAFPSFEQPTDKYENLNHIEQNRSSLVEQKLDKQALLEEIDKIEYAINDAMNNLKNIVKAIDDEKTKH